MNISPSRQKNRKRLTPALLWRILETLESRVLLSGNSYNISLYSFTGGSDGAGPFAGLVADSLGNLYGTTVAGGTSGDGSIYELPIDNNSVITLHDFAGNGDGANPYAGLTIDSLGDIFGTTFAGGASNLGTIYEIPTGTTDPVLLYSFSGSDGANPYAALTIDPSGNIFGTTTKGGSFNDGTVFEISSGALNTIHSFNAAVDGETPYGPITVVGTDIYGTTFGGTGGIDGSVFKMSGGVFSTIHLFSGEPDGARTTGKLAVDGGGNIFGTTSSGGTSDDGTVFGILASTSTLTTLYSFTGGNDGSTPFAGMVFDPTGNLFGTTYKGGAFGNGTVFEIPVDGVTPETLHAFAGGSDGANPYAGILVSPQGNFFGATTAGGVNKHGTLFELSPNATTQLTVAQQPSVVQAGAKPTFVIDLQKVNLTNNTADDSNVTLSIVDGPDGAALIGTSTVTARNGVATFTNLQLTRAGTYTLAASDGSLDPVTLDTIVVNPGPAAKLAFGQQPTSLVAGQTIAPAVTVEIEDSLGNVITTSNSMVTLKIGSGPAAAPFAGTLIVQAIDGVATFDDLSLTKVGTYTLSASSGHFSLLKSAAFAVTPDLASEHFVILQQPGNAIVGKKLAPNISVNVQDQFGNLITNTTGQLSASLVTLTLGGNATSAQLTGTPVANVSKGAATFGNLFISQPGDYQLQISGGGLTPVTTNTIHSFFVPTHLVFSQQPLQTTAGATFTPAIVVSILDATNRVDTTNDSLVTLALKGNGTLNGTVTVAAIDGVATFNGLSIDQAGTFTLSAASTALSSAKSATFHILPDVSTSHLVLATSPAGIAIVGKNLAPNLVVDVVDQFGNRITTDHSAATISIADGPTSGALTGLTTVNASSGVVTFKNLALPLAGAYSLQISDASLADTTPVLIAQTITQGVTTLSGLPKTLSRIFGQTISLTASLKSNAPTSIPFTGIATLVGSQNDVLGTVSLTAAGQAKFNVTGVAPGTYLCDVSYPGDANHTSLTSSTFTLQVGLATTSTLLTALPTTLTTGQTLTLTAIVNSSNAPGVVRTGSVSFYDGLILLATDSLDGSSTASFILTPTTGKHAFKAVYSGDDDFKISTSSAVSRTVK